VWSRDSIEFVVDQTIDMEIYGPVLGMETPRVDVDSVDFNDGVSGTVEARKRGHAMRAIQVGVYCFPPTPQYV
jgi:hypothetical protein